LVAGLACRELADPLRGQTPSGQPAPPTAPREGPKLAPDSSAAYDPNWDKSYPQYQPAGKGKVLQPCPDCKHGDLCEQDLSVYGGAGRTSYASVEDVGNFDDFYRRLSENKAEANRKRREYMEQRYQFTGATRKDVAMTRSKPVPLGPVVRLPKGVAS